MYLESLYIKNVRNLFSVEMSFTSNFNFIIGENGSGKTSILEAIYMLGMGRSFRTKLSQKVITFDEESCLVVGKVVDPQNNKVVSLGIERFRRNGIKKIQVKNIFTTKISELVKVLPLQHIGPESFLVITGEPIYRRQYLDWLMFHVEPKFLSSWQKFSKILLQRNNCLKNKRDICSIEAWDCQYLAAATLVTENRSKHILELQNEVINLASKMLPSIVSEHLELVYYPGWKIEKGLADSLADSKANDLLCGFTNVGPNRADLKIKIDGKLARDILSRGQIKVLVYILYLARAKMLLKRTGRHSVFLLDDIQAELDPATRKILLENIEQINSQVIITGTDVNIENIVKREKMQMFHVEHGKVVNLNPNCSTWNNKQLCN